MDFYFIFHFYLERQEYEKTKRAFNCIVVNYEINSIGFYTITKEVFHNEYIAKDHLSDQLTIMDC